ncbi:MAG: winged helix-turn-helix domain-containing protein [archaeon]|nr:winged helix-turn-helix domain-containing protein [archaeon]
MPRFRLMIRRIERPSRDSFEEEFNWLCKSLGFFEPIDKEKTASQIFMKIVKSTEQGKGISSTQLSESVEMSRGSIINHLNNLQEAGLIERDGRVYRTRASSVSGTIDELEADVMLVFQQMRKIATEIDKEFDEPFSESFDSSQKPFVIDVKKEKPKQLAKPSIKSKNK